MSSAAAILAIVVAAGEARDPATATIVAAAAEALGPQISVRLIEDSAPAEVDPLRIEHDLGAGAVITLVWRDATRLRAMVRLHVASNDRTTIRELVFSASDTRAERGRTLGLAAASMWPETLAAGRGEASPRAPPATEPVARPAPAPIEQAPPQPPAVAGPVAVAERDGSPAVTRFGLGISAEGAAGIGGPAAAVGASLHGVVPVATSWLLGVGLGLRAGSIPALPGSRVVVGTLGAGVEWWPAALQAGRIASLGLRADALAMRHQVSASVIAGRSETEGRFQAGVDVMAQLGLRIGARLQVLAAAGAEETFGTTEIRTGNPPVTVATIPALRLTAELGVRVGF